MHHAALLRKADDAPDFCCATFGLVIWPVKFVHEMTYDVSSGTLNPTHSLTQYVTSCPRPAFSCISQIGLRCRSSSSSSSSMYIPAGTAVHRNYGMNRHILTNTLCELTSTTHVNLVEESGMWACYLYIRDKQRLLRYGIVSWLWNDRHIIFIRHKDRKWTTQGRRKTNMHSNLGLIIDGRSLQI